jgi:hypothetical protein
MTKVEEIEQKIEELSRAEFAEIREWILERDWERWDAQIEQDVKAGKLEGLISESQEDYQSGRSREL